MVGCCETKLFQHRVQRAGFELIFQVTHNGAPVGQFLNSVGAFAHVGMPGAAQAALLGQLADAFQEVRSGHVQSTLNSGTAVTNRTPCSGWVGKMGLHLLGDSPRQD